MSLIRDRLIQLCTVDRNEKRQPRAMRMTIEDFAEFQKNHADLLSADGSRFKMPIKRWKNGRQVDELPEGDGLVIEIVRQDSLDESKLLFEGEK